MKLIYFIFIVYSSGAWHPQTAKAPRIRRLTGALQFMVPGVLMDLKTMKKQALQFL